MDDFSIPTDSQVFVEATQEKEWNFLHALKGIGNGERSGIFCIRYLFLSFPFIIMYLCQYSGKYPRLSRGRPGFNSPTERTLYHIFLCLVTRQDCQSKSIIITLQLIFYYLVHISFQNILSIKYLTKKNTFFIIFIIFLFGNASLVC